jgi:hypothetical protein
VIAREISRNTNIILTDRTDLYSDVSINKTEIIL